MQTVSVLYCIGYCMVTLSYFHRKFSSGRKLGSNISFVYHYHLTSDRFLISRASREILNQKFWDLFFISFSENCYRNLIWWIETTIYWLTECSDKCKKTWVHLRAKKRGTRWGKIISTFKINYDWLIDLSTDWLIDWLTI